MTNLLLPILLLLTQTAVWGKSESTVTLSNDRTWLGEWIRTEHNNFGRLTISNVTQAYFDFEIFALSGTHDGFDEGRAYIQGNKALFQYPALIEGRSCTIHFEMNSNVSISVNQVEGLCGTALGVSFSGIYFSPDNKPAEQTTLLNINVLENEAQDQIFRNMVGEHYELFVYFSQLSSARRDLDGLSATVEEYFVRGLYGFSGYILMKGNNDTFWTALLNGNEVLYFTNRSGWERRLPETIKNWMEEINRNRVIYMN